MARNVKSLEELNISDKYRVVYTEYLDDCKAFGIILRHIKSGARICVLSNDDENKVFNIIFKTIPYDDTGAAHITEHTVLCGSKKFPCKDPFNELEKGSLCTFLNAYTYPDKTCYPVASCNDKDFANLMDVYMDAVLNPNIYTKPEIFEQEGWHYEIENPDDPITINGIVYSEMKGLFSSPEDRISRGVFRELFEGTVYANESGGIPEKIPELTYGQFLDFHRKYYHPSNSYIYLYGNIDIEERLNWLDENYLKNYDAVDTDLKIEFRMSAGEKNVTGYYALTEGESEECACYIEWASIAGNFDECEKLTALTVILNALFNIQGAPVREAVIGEGLGCDISAYIDGDLLQPLIRISLSNTEAEYLDRFKEILNETLKRVAQDGFDRNAMLGIINRMEFDYRENDSENSVKGLDYILDSASTWLYDDNKPFTDLHQGEVFVRLREMLDSDYYTELVKNCLLKSESSIYYVLKPQKNFAEEENRKLEKRLAEYKASLSDDEIKALIERNKELKLYRSTPSSREEIETVPILSRDDINVEPLPVCIEKYDIDGTTVLHSSYETNDIVYLRLFFNLNVLKESEIELLELFCKLVSGMDKKDCSYAEMNTMIDIHTGGISASLISFMSRFDSDYYRPMLMIDTKFMKNEADNALDVLKKFVLDTDFSSLKRARELMNETHSRMHERFSSSCNVAAMRLAASGLCSSRQFEERINGITYYRFVNKVLGLDDNGLTSMLNDIRAAVEKVIVKNNSFVQITCNDEIKDNLFEKLGSFLGEFADNGVRTENFRGWKFETENKSLALRYSGDVNYVCLAGKYENLDVKKSGILELVTCIINNDYLYGKIRVLGGAYGCGFRFDGYACIGSYFSYRDPNFANTIECFKGVSEYLRNYDSDERELLKNIIGTFGKIGMPLSPNSKGIRALNMYMNASSADIVRERRNAIKNATIDDIRALADVFEQIENNASICAVTSEQVFKKEKNILRNSEVMFEKKE